MSSVVHLHNSSDAQYDGEMCKKISIAIKRSKIFSHIEPMNLLKEKLGLNDTEENCLDNKRHKIQNPRQLGSPIKSIHIYKSTLLPTPESIIPVAVSSSTNSIMHKPESPVKDISKVEIMPFKSMANDHDACANVQVSILPSPKNLFGDALKLDKQVSVTNSKVNASNESKVFNEECVYLKNAILVKFADVNKNKINDICNASTFDKSIKNEKSREKQNKNLFNLATSLLPAPSLLYDKDSLINVLLSGDILEFVSIFKEVVKSEDRFSADDLCEVIDAIVKGNKLSIFPEICSCLEFISFYSQSLSNCFIKYKTEMKDCKDSVLGCLVTMIDSEINTSITSFIEACFCVNDWNMMWTCVLAKSPEYVFEEKYFNACMAVFQGLHNDSTEISHDTMLIIIKYIMKYHSENYEAYMADIWLYCVLSSDINSETDLRVPQTIIDKVIEKLITMKNIPFLFVMELLSKNLTILYHTSFCVWLSHLLADNGDVIQGLLSLKESIAACAENHQELNNSFLLLSLNVMSVLNKRSLFTVSRNVYEILFENNLGQLKNLLLTRIDKFEYKWIIVDCLISSANYQSALSILTDFDMLKDTETSFKEYDRVKAMLPTLIINVLDTSNLSAVIDLFEQIVSIFVFDEANDDSYAKNSSKILDLIIVKVFESKNKEIVKQMIVLVDHIVCSDIDFKISKESLRYLLVSSVQADIPFNELLDLIEKCFKSDIFESIQTAEDGLGSVVSVDSSLSGEEVIILITWLCRHIKLKLVDLAQSDGASVRNNLMKVCNLKFILCPSKSSNDLISKFGSNTSLNDLQSKFTESLSSPKYLSHPIKFATTNDSHDKVAIICDNRILYNAVYYSDI